MQVSYLLPLSLSPACLNSLFPLFHPLLSSISFTVPFGSLKSSSFFPASMLKFPWAEDAGLMPFLGYVCAK